MKIKLNFSLFFCILTYCCYGQEDKLDSKKGNNSLYNLNLPALIQGNLFENNTTSAFTLNSKDQTIEFEGVIYTGKLQQNNFRAKIGAGSENNVAALFNENKIIPKATGSISYNHILRSWISYDATMKTELDKMGEDQRYNALDNFPAFYGSNRKHTFVGSLGLNFNGAKYFLIDTLRQNLDSMIYKKNYSGWEFYLQFSKLTYFYKTNSLLYWTLRGSYGEVNNIEDLTEYSINLSRTFPTPGASNKNIFERKITGYFNSYQLHHRGTISFECGYLPKLHKRQLGFLFGTEIIYNEKNKNNYKLNLGTNIPIKKKDKEDTSLFYVSAIVASNDPFNIYKADDFQFGKSIEVYLRLAFPLNLEGYANK